MTKCLWVHHQLWMNLVQICIIAARQITSGASNSVLEVKMYIIVETLF